jgi:hypothetical protein
MPILMPDSISCRCLMPKSPERVIQRRKLICGSVVRSNMLPKQMLAAPVHIGSVRTRWAVGEGRLSASVLNRRDWV